MIVSTVGLGQQQSDSALRNQSKESIELNYAPEANFDSGKAVAAESCCHLQQKCTKPGAW